MTIHLCSAINVMPDDQPSPPQIDPALAARLAELAATLDGGQRSLSEEMVEEFNALAGTDLSFSDFQGIYWAEEHIDFVRRILVAQATEADRNLTRQDLVEMFRRVLDDPCDDEYLTFVFQTVEKTYGDRQASDLVFWPGEYFGDGDHSRVLTPEEMADAVLKRYEERST